MNIELGEAKDAFQKDIAASCNNKAWDLIEQSELSDEDCAELVMLAATARHHWHAIGSVSNKAHADLLFGWALARAGAGAASVGPAKDARDFFEASDSLPWERAFAHAALAAAFKSSGDDAGYAEHYRQAAALGEVLKPEGKKLFDAAFRTLPSPC